MLAKLTLRDKKDTETLNFLKFMKKNLRKYLEVGLTFEFVSIKKNVKTKKKMPMLEIGDKNVDGFDDIKNLLEKYHDARKKVKAGGTSKPVNPEECEDYLEYVKKEAKLTPGSAGDDDEVPENAKRQKEIQENLARMNQNRNTHGLQTPSSGSSAAGSASISLPEVRKDNLIDDEPPRRTIPGSSKPQDMNDEDLLLSKLSGNSD